MLSLWYNVLKSKLMKSLITILFTILLTVTSAMASSKPKVIISDETVEVISTEHSEIFASAEFDSVKENLKFMTTTDVSMIKIYSETGILEFQLPVESADIKIHKSLFGEGKYKLGFILQGQSKEVFTLVTIK